jgi:hypothetical protein
MSKQRKGRRNSEESKIKCSISHIGLGHTQETKDKLSKINMGKHLSIETINKIKETKKRNELLGINKKRDYTKMCKSIICIETKIIYPSIKNCAENMNIFAQNISDVLHNKQKAVKGFHFKYWNNND